MSGGPGRTRRAAIAFGGIVGLLAAALPVGSQALPAPAGLRVGPAADFAEWGSALPLDPRVLDEMGRYSERGGEPLARGDAEALATAARLEVLAAAGSGVARLLEGACEPRIDISFGESALGSHSIPDRTRFSDEVVRAEVVACFHGDLTDPEEVLGIYTSPEFRMATETRIRSIDQEGGESCVATRGVSGLLAPSRACNRIERYSGELIAAEHSQVISNPGAEAGGVQEVYFKESLKTFVVIPGGMALHYVNISRTADLGRLGRWVGARSIRDGEERKAEGLRARLR